MNAHPSIEDIKSYLARTLARTDFDKVSDHVYSCETCHQDLLTELQRRFPIEIDLDELAGMRDWHLEGEELAAYIEKRMDDLESECANLHLEECRSCQNAVENAIEYSLEQSRLKNHQANKKNVVWGSLLADLPSARKWIAGIAAAVLIAIALWAALQARPEKSQLAEAPPSTPDAQGIVLPEQPTSPPPRISENNHSVDRSASQTIGPAPNRGKRETERQRGTMEAALIAKDLVMPPSIERFDRTPAVAIRGDHPAVESFSVIEPFATLTSIDRPTFRWTALTGATSYVVSVYDEALHLVRSSEALIDTHWSTPERLKAGVVYTWTVTALKDGKEIIAPAPPTRAEFRVLRGSQLVNLSRRIKETASRAARGVVYAEAGLLDDAEKEFQTHLAAAPGDDRVRKLLQTIRSWRAVEP